MRFFLRVSFRGGLDMGFISGHFLKTRAASGLSGHRTNATFCKHGGTGALWIPVDQSVYFTHM